MHRADKRSPVIVGVLAPRPQIEAEPPSGIHVVYTNTHPHGREKKQVPTHLGTQPPGARGLTSHWTPPTLRTGVHRQTGTGRTHVSRTLSHPCSTSASKTHAHPWSLQMSFQVPDIVVFGM